MRRLALHLALTAEPRESAVVRRSVAEIRLCRRGIAWANGGAPRHFKPLPAPFLHNVRQPETNGNIDYGEHPRTALSAILVCPKLPSCASSSATPCRNAAALPTRSVCVRVACPRMREYRETDLGHRGGRSGTRRGNHDHLLIRRRNRLHDGVRRGARRNRLPVQSPPESLSMTRRSRLVGRPCSAAAGSR